MLLSALLAAVGAPPWKPRNEPAPPTDGLLSTAASWAISDVELERGRGGDSRPPAVIVHRPPKVGAGFGGGGLRCPAPVGWSDGGRSEVR